MRIKKLTCTAMVCIMSLVMLFSGSGDAVSNAASQADAVYEFDHTKTAVRQLIDLFTTIDIMDATVADWRIRT